MTRTAIASFRPFVRGWTTAFAALGVALLLASTSAHADQLAAGRQLAEDMCGTCHAIIPGRESAHAQAPTFRKIAGRYSVWNLQEALAEGIVVGHADMPEITLKPEQINALLSYMDTLSPEASRR